MGTLLLLTNFPHNKYQILDISVISTEEGKRIRFSFELLSIDCDDGNGSFLDYESAGKLIFMYDKLNIIDV